MLHELPNGEAKTLPNAFHINSLLELRKKLSGSNVQLQTCPSLQTCPKHNDPLKMYCETCNAVICRDCTISKEHNKHQFELISECYPKHLQQIQDELKLLKQKSTDIDKAVTALAAREIEVLEQGEDIKKQIHTHAQQLIDQVQRSERHLLQWVDAIMQQKRHLLIKQREQAERVHTQLKNCQEKVQQNLKEWKQHQVIMQKMNLLYQMKTVSQDVEPTVFIPIEEANIKFLATSHISNGIGELTSFRYGDANVDSSFYSSKAKSTATLTLQSHDGSPFSLPPSLISCILSSHSELMKCDITQKQQGKYNISFTPYTTGEHQLIVQMAGVNISGSPFNIPVISPSTMRGKPVKIITGLNRPMGIEVCDNGDIVVAEFGTHCVTIMNKEGKKLRSFGTKGTKEGQFVYPRGVAISTSGHIFITDEHRVQKVTSDGVYVKSVGSSKGGDSHQEFYCPGGITICPTTGQVFVADSDNNRIQVFKNDLTFSHTIVLHGKQAFSHPYDVSLDSEGYLYVAKYGDNCITKLTLTGQYITKFSTDESAAGRPYKPSSLTIHNNLVYVTEDVINRVSILDSRGTRFHCFGKYGSGKGEFDSPRGLTTDRNGNLYVSDTMNNRIVIF